MDGRAVRRPCLSSLFFHGGRGSPRNNPQTRLEFDLPVSLEGSLSRTRLCLVETGQWWGKEGKMVSLDRWSSGRDRGDDSSQPDPFLGFYASGCVGSKALRGGSSRSFQTIGVCGL